jgi:hypothetical protein
MLCKCAKWIDASEMNTTKLFFPSPDNTIEAKFTNQTTDVRNSTQDWQNKQAHLYMLQGFGQRGHRVS